MAIKVEENKSGNGWHWQANSGEHIFSIDIPIHEWLKQS